MGISSWETRRYRRVWKRYLSRHHIDGAWLALGNGGAKEPAAAAEYPHRQQVCHAQAGQAADSTRMPQHGAQNSADIDAPRLCYRHHGCAGEGHGGQARRQHAWP